MRKVLCGVTVALILSAVTARAEEKIPLDKLPKAVTEAVKKKFPKAELVGAETEKEDGKEVYELALKTDGGKIEVTVTPEGKILGIERVLAAKDLPKVVADAVEAKYPKAVHKKIEEVSKNDKIEKYEIVIVTADKKSLEVSFDPRGKFLGEEKRDEKKEEKKDKE